jgi:hypothetical protein
MENIKIKELMAERAKLLEKKAKAPAEPATERKETEIENRAREIMYQKVLLQEQANDAFYAGDLEKAQELNRESLVALEENIWQFFSFGNEKNIPPDIKELRKRFTDLSYGLENKLKRLAKIDAEEKELLAMLAKLEAKERVVPRPVPPAPPKPTPMPAQEIKKMPEMEKMETFSIEFIKQKSLEFLTSIKSIQKLNDFSIENEKGNIKVRIDFEGEGTKRLMGVDVKITVKGVVTTILGNTGGTIGIIGKPKIEASMVDKKLIERELSPKLNEIPEMLKSFIEKEKNKKVDKMEIENGVLKVTYK